MGRSTFSRSAYESMATSRLSTGRPVTADAEQRAHRTGKLDALVDPAGYGVIRPSRLRFEQRDDGLFEVTVGLSVPSESRTDTTGSMGDNVDIAMRVLGRFYDLGSSVLPGSDLHVSSGIFGDVVDDFVLCRPQFEMSAEKIVDQLGRMVPERMGGDSTEDPQYGIFGGAYLTDFYINKIGLKSYDFTVTDADARDRLSSETLIRVFGPEVFERLAENGFPMNRRDLPTTREIVRDLLKRAHAFLLLVQGGGYDRYSSYDSLTRRYWANIYGDDRVITLPTTEMLPQVQATIIGLTEGTLALSDVPDFLRSNNVREREAQAILRSVSMIPIGAQAALPNYGRRPQKGDLFRSKTDLWPIGQEEVQDLAPATRPRPPFPGVVNPVADQGPDWI